MVECWNIGKMGLEVMQYWKMAKAVITIKLKWMMSFENPLFHYSMIKAKTNANNDLYFHFVAKDRQA
jgi:hypothetical protein